MDQLEERVEIDRDSNTEKSEDKESSRVARDIRSMPWFCFMIVNFRPEQKINTWIEESLNPFISLKLHNNKGVILRKCTKSAAGSWELEMIIGPFYDWESATEFVSAWKLQSRGITSRRERGKQLAAEMGLTCWDQEVSRQNMNKKKNKFYKRNRQD
jgi:hypothetical protein